DLVLVDLVTEVRVDALDDRGAEAPEDQAALPHPLHGDVGVDVAAAEERRGVVQRPAVEALVELLTDQSARQRDDAAVARGVARGELAGQAGPLGEAQEDDPPAGDAGGQYLLEGR